MSYKKISVILDRLHKNTMNGDIDWEESIEESLYEVSFSNFTTRISYYENIDQYILQIINDEGKVIEGVQHDDLHEFLTDPRGMMKEIYEKARRQVLGVEDALDTILENLDDPDVW